MASRRRTVLGLGGLLAGGGALVSTGAFDTVQAERSVGLETAGDANAFLSLKSLDEDFVDPDAELIEFEIPGSASVTYNELVLVTNRGTQTVTSLRFEFVVEGADQPDAAVEDAMRIVSGEAEIDAVDEVNLIAASDAGDAGDDDGNRLDPGDSIPFGIKIDLTAVDIDEISGDPDITLRIIAESGGVPDDDPDPGPPVADPDFELTEGPVVSSGSDRLIEFSLKTDSLATVGGFNLAIDSPGANEPEFFGGFTIFDGPETVIEDDTGGAVGDDIIFDGDTLEFDVDDELGFEFRDLDQNPGGNWRVTFTLLDGDEAPLGSVEADLEQG